jgi:glycosyltransferase involved in cell wall biosynthesis
MQRGVPVIVTPQVGAADIVRTAHAGIVVGGDPESLGGGINQLLMDQTLAGAMGKSGQDYISKQYGWHRIAAQMESLYEQLRSKN